jgi:cytochrome d ubiquinol oxidase subunit II
MIPTWYALASSMLIIYVTLDGRNFGAGMVHRLVARTPEERRQVIAAIGPLWSWHEVWLVAFGGTLFAVFPRLLASAFAGYYLALVLILWALILRGMSLEVGGHIDGRLWQGFWDVIFAFSSFLLAVLFGAAGGNLARGVPVDEHGDFSMPFFTDFDVRGRVGLLDWYTLSVAFFAAVLLAAHGSTYLAMTTEGPVRDRSGRCARRLWAAALPLFVSISVETRVVRPDLPGGAVCNPFWYLGLMVVVVSAIALISGLACGRERRAFVGSSFLIAGLLLVGGAALFPIMLRSTLSPEYSLSVYAVAASPRALRLALVWWPFGFVLTLTYVVFISRRYCPRRERAA